MSQLFDQATSDDLDKLILSDPKAALSRIRELAVTYGEQPFFRHNYGSRLVDLGRDLRNPELLRAGIREIERVIDQISPQLRDRFLINLASAHYHLHLAPQRAQRWTMPIPTNCRPPNPYLTS
jgi:hypothetical protein